MDKTIYKKATEIRMWLGTALQKERQKYQAAPVLKDMMPQHTVAQGWGYVVLGYSLIEQGLKAVLHMRDMRGSVPPKTHDLSRLFAEFCAKDQEVLRAYYDDFRCAAPDMSAFPPATLDDFLKNLDGRRNDQGRHVGSVDWRYFLTEVVSCMEMPIASIDFMHEVVEGCVWLIESINKGDNNAEGGTYSRRLRRRRARRQNSWLALRRRWWKEGDRIELWWGPDYAGRCDYLVVMGERGRSFFRPLPNAEDIGLDIIDKRREFDSFDSQQGLRSIGILVA